jgi:hypothetical protein
MHQWRHRMVFKSQESTALVPGTLVHAACQSFPAQVVSICLVEFSHWGAYPRGLLALPSVAHTAEVVDKS